MNATPDWFAPLVSLLGGEKVTTSAEIIAAHSGDKWSASHPPEVVVFAESTADVSAVMAFAGERGARPTPPLLPCAGLLPSPQPACA